MDPKIKSSWVKYLPFLVIPLLVITWGISRYQSPQKVHVNHLQIKTNLTPLGQGVLPEQRRAFALQFQKNAHIDIRDGIFTTTGEFHTIFSIQSNRINSEMVSSMTGIEEPFSALRGMGFKHLILSNGKEAWDIDLRN